MDEQRFCTVDENGLQQIPSKEIHVQNNMKVQNYKIRHKMKEEKPLNFKAAAIFVS